MWFLWGHRRTRLSCFESTRSGLWLTAALIIACLAPWASAVAVDPPQTREDQSSSSPPYAELLPAEPQDSQPTLQEIEREARANTEIIQPHMSRSDFVALCRRLELDESQTACAHEAFDRYDHQVQEIHQEHLDRIMPLALQYFQALQEGGEELARTQAGGAVAAVAKISERYQAQIRHRLGAFLGQLQTCFSESQLQAYPGALRAWRRSVMLNPGVSGGFCRNLVYHVDLFKVIDQACQDEPALLTLLDRQAEDPSDPALSGGLTFGLVDRHLFGQDSPDPGVATWLYECVTIGNCSAGPGPPAPTCPGGLPGQECEACQFQLARAECQFTFANIQCTNTTTPIFTCGTRWVGTCLGPPLFVCMLPPNSTGTCPLPTCTGGVIFE